MQPEADRVPGGGLTNCGNQNATARFSGHNAPLALLQSPDDSPAQLRAGRAIFRPDRPRHERNLHAWVVASRVVSFRVRRNRAGESPVGGNRDQGLAFSSAVVLKNGEIR